MQLNHERFLATFDALKQLFPDDGGELGYNRPAFSDREKMVHSWLAQQLKNMPIQVSNDSIGNTFGRLGNQGGPAIGIGSHLDTVKNGGLYDGAYGTLAALEVIRSLADQQVTLTHDVLLTCFVGEEVNPLGGTFGSRALAGQLEPADSEFFDQATVASVKLVPQTYSHFLELHIEQSTTLVRTGVTIGIPNAIAGIVRYEYNFIGRADHAGATMMPYRQDALVAASQFVTNVSECAKVSQEQLVATVGKLDVFPNSPTVIPGRVELVLEVRAVDMEKARDFHDQMNAWLLEQQIKFTDKCITNKASGHLSQQMQTSIEQAAIQFELPFMHLFSGANHDVNAMSKISEAGLIFVPSVDGISHNPKEFTKDNDLLAGLDVMGEVIFQLATSSIN